MRDNPSRRVVHQRLRNRLVERVGTLTEGDAGVWSIGEKEWFNHFFDFVPDNCEPHPNPAMTEEELAGIAALCRLVDQALDDTPLFGTEEDLITTGWPEKIRPEAEKVLALFLTRGRFFNENVEEDEPSLP